MDVTRVDRTALAALEALESGDLRKAQVQVELLRKMLEVEQEVNKELMKTVGRLGGKLDIRV